MIFDYFKALIAKKKDGSYEMSDEEFIVKVDNDINKVKKCCTDAGSHFKIIEGKILYNGCHSVHMTPLTAAIKAKRFDLVHKLAKVPGFDIDTIIAENGYIRNKDYDQTALYHAINEGKEEEVALLIDLGANLSFIDFLGHNALEKIKHRIDTAERSLNADPSSSIIYPPKLLESYAKIQTIIEVALSAERAKITADTLCPAMNTTDETCPQLSLDAIKPAQDSLEPLALIGAGSTEYVAESVST